MVTVFCLLTLIDDYWSLCVHQTSILIKYLNSLRPQWYILYALVNRHSLAQKMLHQLFCVKPLCHPVLTSPFNQHEHISFMSVNFYLKIQQLSLYIFFPSCCCDLLAVVPGLSSTSRLPSPPPEGDPAPVSPRLHERLISQWLISDQCWSGGLGDIWFLYLFGGGNFLSHVIILTITRRDTFGRLRSINPNMINHVAKQSPLLF